METHGIYNTTPVQSACRSVIDRLFCLALGLPPAPISEEARRVLSDPATRSVIINVVASAHRSIEVLLANPTCRGALRTVALLKLYNRYILEL